MIKKTRKIKLVEEVVEILRQEGRPETHDEVSKWVMTQVNKGTHDGGKYGSIYHGDISLYFREFHAKAN